MKNFRRREPIPLPWRVLPGLLLGLFVLLRHGAAEPAKLILALGDDSYIPAEAVNALTGAEIKRELGGRDLQEFSVLILSNIPYGLLPPSVREGIPEFVNRGGSLLITGGPNSYGSGGYEGMASLIPFEIRAKEDWRSVPFKPIIFIEPEHPILAGVTFRTVGNFNDLNPKKTGATEIARYAGGGRTITIQEPIVGPDGKPTGIQTRRETIGARYPSPLIAQQRVGQGTVLGIAFDPGREISDGWVEGPRFVQNVLTYLLEHSLLRPGGTDSLWQAFYRWQEACDRKLRRGFVGGIYWETTAADCRRELVERGYPYMDLVALWLRERLVIGEREERGELSGEEAGLELRELNARIHTEIQERQETAR